MLMVENTPFKSPVLNGVDLSFGDFLVRVLESSSFAEFSTVPPHQYSSLGAVPLSTSPPPGHLFSAANL